MKITLLDINKKMCEEWEKRFKDIKNINIVNSDFESYANKLHSENSHFIIVSPANSFGMMDGGYDLAITRFYWNKYRFDIIKHVQEYINTMYYGEQPIGTTIFIKLPHPMPNLIHTPTMRFPMDVRNTNNVYMCMKATLGHIVFEDEFDEIIIPAFGGGCGKVPFDRIAYEMRLAYDRVFSEEKLDLSSWNKISNEVAKQGNYFL